MKFIIKLAWRNLWRNPLRSGALLISIALGVVAGLFAAGLVKGILEERFDSIITSETSHLQIHHPEFRSEQQSQFFLENPKELLEQLNNDEEVTHFSTRTLANGLIASSAASSGIQIIGVDVENELILTQFDQHLIEGTYFAEEMRYPILLGNKLVRKLNLSLGSRVVLSFQDVNSEITSAAFRMAGVYRTSNAMNDEVRAYVCQQDLQKIMGDEVIHQVAVLLQNHEGAHDFVDRLNEQFPNYNALPWDELAPELRYLVEQSGVSTYIFMIIILIGLGFGILNTMLMAVFERTRELGMLLALGMNKLKVFVMIIFETILLAFSGAVLGLILGYATIRWVAIKGINMGEGMAEFGYQPIVYPVLEGQSFINISLLVFVIAVLAALYPALKAIALVPAEAVRK